jgi:hypothetical protein
MSLPRSNYDPRRVCLNPFPGLDLGKHRRTVGVYLAGALFALANWTFIDAAVLSAHAPAEESTAHVSFVDWVPGLCTLLGMLVVNVIDKDRVRGEDGFGDPRAVWRARLVLFLGFALMAGGLAGSVVRFISSLKVCDADTHTPSADRPGAEIRPPRVPGTNDVLWLRQRVAERGAHAVGGRPLDRAERQHRVRV